MTGLQILGIIIGFVYIISGLGLVITMVVFFMWIAGIIDENKIKTFRNKRFFKPCHKCKTRKQWVFKPNYCKLCKLSRNKDLFEKE